ncbi:hypothetical protein JQ506_26185 (plasmid) [Shinella sp. PSBB067]|uniref:hypothetical protein n=1 Tax=Shinella sp. PSBB067 TaxID=2715959 RepID=UPI00193B0DBA|nr:hypothetical protein [Shinella sp. PSBB067]QRI66263.1 hypothetical protein JQ506_26185 [Shinella sp. PSBB067]
MSITARPRHRRKTAAALLLAMAFLLPGCRLIGLYNWSWNQELELTVITPDGEISGSSVIRASYGFRPEWWGWGDRGRSIIAHSGEAAFVEVASGRYLFAIMSENDPAMAYETFIGPITTSREERIEGFDRLYRLRETRALPRELYPTLVTFRDINDPASVEKVDPDNLEATFGPGYRLASIEIAITSNPKSSGRIIRVIPWTKEYQSKQLDGNRYETIKSNNRFANSLASGFFTTESE